MAQSKAKEEAPKAPKVPKVPSLLSAAEVHANALLESLAFLNDDDISATQYNMDSGDSATNSDSDSTDFIFD